MTEGSFSDSIAMHDIRRFSRQSPLSEEQYQQFFQQGFTRITAFFDDHDITVMRRAMDQLMVLARQLGRQHPLSGQSGISHQGSYFVLKEQNNRTRVERVVGCGSAAPVLLDYSRHPRLLACFADLLNTSRFEQLIIQFHPKEPHDRVVFYPHRDIRHRRNYDPHWQDVNGFGSWVISVIAVDPSMPDNGCLRALPGSHLNYRSTLKNDRSDIILTDQQRREGAALPLAPGDVLFMHPYLIHWSNANQSDTSRYSLLSGVACQGANRGRYPGDCSNAILEACRT